MESRPRGKKKGRCGLFQTTDLMHRQKKRNFVMEEGKKKTLALTHKTPPLEKGVNGASTG